MGQFVLAATGHRPPRLGLSYDAASRLKLLRLARRVIAGMTNRPDMIFSGLAQGWDQAAAGAALLLKIPLHVAIPFDGQEAKWPADARGIYQIFLRKAAKVTTVCPGGPAAWKYIRRDEFMVDNSHALLTLFDGDRTGGTWATVSYAAKKGLDLIDVWPSWSSYSAG